MPNFVLDVQKSHPMNLAKILRDRRLSMAWSSLKDDARSCELRILSEQKLRGSPNKGIFTSVLRIVNTLDLDIPLIFRSHQRRFHRNWRYPCEMTKIGWPNHFFPRFEKHALSGTGYKMTAKDTLSHLDWDVNKQI